MKFHLSPICNVPPPNSRLKFKGERLNINHG
jgi:hypothetical protein